MSFYVAGWFTGWGASRWKLRSGRAQQPLNNSLALTCIDATYLPLPPPQCALFLKQQLSTSVARTAGPGMRARCDVIFSPAIGGIYDVAAFNISGGPSANSRCRSLDASGTATPTRHAPPTRATSSNSAHPLTICYKRPIAACIKR
jgi:hypothetical protein